MKKITNPLFLWIICASLLSFSNVEHKPAGQGPSIAFYEWTKSEICSLNLELCKS